MRERQIFHSAEFGTLVSCNPLPDAFLYRVSFGDTARALILQFVIQSRALPGDESISGFVPPNLLPDTPHLKDWIIVIVRCACLPTVLLLVPIEQRVIV